MVVGIVFAKLVQNLVGGEGTEWVPSVALVALLPVPGCLVVVTVNSAVTLTRTAANTTHVVRLDILYINVVLWSTDLIMHTA